MWRCYLRNRWWLGGAGAELTGGNFWKGAVTGLVFSGLNHAMHKNDESVFDGDDPLPKTFQTDEISIQYNGTKITVLNSKGEVIYEH